MAKLDKFPVAKQAVANSCWACAARMISNYYQAHGKSGTNPVYVSDQELATAWATVTKKPQHGDINVMQSASGALTDLRYKNNIDSAPVPTLAEIETAINAKDPLLAIVGADDPKGKPDKNYQKGHWLVIVGVDTGGKTIDVFDPDDGIIHTIAYNAATYKAGSFWENTSYVDAYKMSHR